MWFAFGVGKRFTHICLQYPFIFHDHNDHSTYTSSPLYPFRAYAFAYILYIDTAHEHSVQIRMMLTATPSFYRAQEDQTGVFFLEFYNEDLVYDLELCKKDDTIREDLAATDILTLGAPVWNTWGMYGHSFAFLWIGGDIWQREDCIHVRLET